MKRKVAILLAALVLFFLGYGQTVPAATEQQLENQTEADETETEDDSYLQYLENYKQHPLNLNEAEEADLKDLRVLTDLQIASLIRYRKLFGNLISVYELQAIPYWDISSIKKLLPFVVVSNDISLSKEIKNRFVAGEHMFLLRASQVLEKSKGFDKSIIGAKYLGSQQRLFFRYRYNYKNLFQFGLVADKDAGEQLFSGAQKAGFDYYSFHLFVRKVGAVQALALGDFTVNMGQGLIQWQSLAFKKSVDVMAVKRQSAVLRPYNSAGEFYFHRGVGITIKKGKIESTAFASIRKLSANAGIDTVSNEVYISSLLSSGYHRTENENADRNNGIQTSFGGNIIYKEQSWQVGFNSVYYQFSNPIRKSDEAYNLYAIRGNSWYNVSADYSYTYKNIHVYGELAIDKNKNKAILNGILMSVDPKVDISIVHRWIAEGYQAVYANAFTESTYPNNEKGLYVGISIRPATALRLDAYADMFKFPWLKYLADAPGSGTDFLAQLTYAPNKQFEIYTRFRNESKQTNQPNNITVTNYLVTQPKKTWRTNLSYRINKNFTFRNRVEMLWFNKKEINAEQGFLTYVDLLYKPMLNPASVSARLQYFETGGYNSRIYAYENDVLYSYTIPTFFDKGYRYYLVFSYNLSKRLSVWLRWSQTHYINSQSIGSGLDEIQGNKKSEIKLQARVIL